MKIASTLEKRQKQWEELEQHCKTIQARSKADDGPQQVARFAALYRSACADLALADAYQLSPGTVDYLHRLVGRAHNQLYRSERLAIRKWGDVLFHSAPQAIFADPCVRISALLFFGFFVLSFYLASNETLFPDYASQVIGAEQLDSFDEMYENRHNAGMGHFVVSSAFYINHNTGIGLRCFALGILIVPCLFTLVSNAVILGGVFGYMARNESAAGDHFFQFVTAHGPFELTAIALSAAAGLRLGIGLVYTLGLNRIASLKQAGLQAVPIMAASALLFILAAFTEGFISPSSLPYAIKAFWSVGSSGLITFYFVVLGFPKDGEPERAA